MRQKENKMKLTKTKLKQIIKEEIAIIQNEGMMDKLKSLNPFGKKEEDRPTRLKRITMEDILKRFGRDKAIDFQNAKENTELRKTVDTQVDALVQKMLDDPRGGGPRDNFERAVRQIANQNSGDIRSPKKERL